MAFGACAHKSTSKNERLWLISQKRKRFAVFQLGRSVCALYVWEHPMIEYYNVYLSQDRKQVSNP